MKKNLVILLPAVFMLFFTACDKANYTLYGQIADHSLDGSYLQIKKYRLRPQESIYIDSVKVENGQFLFGGSTDAPYLMVIANAKGFWGRFVAEPGKIRIAFDPAKDYLRATVSGTRINNDYQKLIIEPSNGYWTVMGPLYEKRKEGLKQLLTMHVLKITGRKPRKRERILSTNIFRMPMSCRSSYFYF